MVGPRFGSRGAALTGQLRRRLALLLALVVTGAGLGVAVGLMQARTVTAEARILISPLDGNAFSPESDDLINLETEAQLVRSDTVARAVAASADVPEDGLLSNLSVSVLPNTQVLSLTYSAGSRAGAEQLAQTFADEFLDYRSQRAERVVDSRSDRIQTQIDTQNDNLTDLVSELDDTDDGSRARVLREQISGINSQIGQLRTQLDEVRTGADDPGEVTTPAFVSSPSPIVLIGAAGVAGGILGLMAALALVIVRVRSENRVHLTDDVEAVGLELLGDVQETELDTLVRNLVEDREEGVVVGSLRALRAAVFSRERRRPVRILMGSSVPGETGPRAAVALAYAAAASGYRTVLVDATSDGRTVTRALGLAGRRGLTDVMRGEMSLDDGLVRLTEHLQVLPCGAIDPRNDDRLSGPLVTTVFERLSDVADIAVVSTGPLLEARSQALALVNDTCLVEAVQGVSSIDELVEISNDLDPVHVLGVVFVRPARSRRRGGGEPQGARSDAGKGRRRATVDANA